MLIRNNNPGCLFILVIKILYCSAKGTLMFKHRLYTTLIYFLLGLIWLFIGTFIISAIDRNFPKTDLTFLYHSKNIIFLFVTSSCLYFLLKAHHKRVLRVEKNYYKLFEGSPGATYVMDKQTFRFLEVNEVMIRKYGYSRKELLQMTALDIRSEEEKGRLQEYLTSEHIEGHETGVWLHRKKNGDLFYVLISYHSIIFQQTEAYIVIAIDVDRSIKNEKWMREIMWSNSHEIRKPASNILGLTELIKQSDPMQPVDAQLIEMLAVSAKELDEIIHKINHHDSSLDHIT